MEKANTPLEQICFNTKDIKKLKEQIAPLYKSNVNLGALANVVNVADTNLTTDIEKAFIVDFNGNLYKFIAFNEDKTKAYIEYYANIKGEKGDTGAIGATGADGQDGARGYSIHYADVDYDENITSYNLSDISQNAPIVANDIVLFKNGYLVLIYSVGNTTCIMADGTAVLLEIGSDSASAGCYLLNNAEDLVRYIGAQYDGQLWQIDNMDNYPLKNGDILLGDDNYIYKIASVDLTNETFRCFKTRELGKSTYTHHISLVKDRYNYILLEIINNNTTPIDNETALKDYLTENGFLMSTPKMAVGYAGGNRTTGIYCELNQLFRNTGADMGGVSIDIENYTITDKMV